MDIGWVSGQPIAGYFIDNACRITGVDGAAGLIGIARENFPDQKMDNR
ncbi:MAG: hypothetical protein ACSHXD_06995 [Marinosulfonomonas sp.]